MSESMSEEKMNLKPGKVYYWIGILVFVVGIALFILILILGLSGMTEGFEQVVVPGKKDINLEKPGTYTIFHEHRSTVNGETYYSEPKVSSLRCIIKNKQGDNVDISNPGMSSEYTFPGRQGYSIAEFVIETPGVYTFAAGYPEGEEGPKVVLAIGYGFTAKLLGVVFGGICTFFGATGGSGLIILLTYLKRRKAKQHRE